MNLVKQEAMCKYFSTSWYDVCPVIFEDHKSTRLDFVENKFYFFFSKSSWKLKSRVGCLVDTAVNHRDLFKSNCSNTMMHMLINNELWHKSVLL